MTTLDPFDFDRYLVRVGLERSALNACAPRSYELLHRIMWAQATHIPWENLATIDPAKRVFHPSNVAGVETAQGTVPTQLRVSLDPADIFHKLVTTNRGGYCYEHNLLLARALREVGFEVDLIAARGVNRMVPSTEAGHPLAPSTHLALLAATNDGQRFLVDDGFVWAGAPRAPLALVHARETVDPSTGEVFRLVRAPARAVPRAGLERWGAFFRTSSAPGGIEKLEAGGGTGWFLQYKPTRETAEFWDMFHFDERDVSTLTDCLTGGWYATTSPAHRHPHQRLAAVMTEDGRVSLVGDVLTVRRGGQVISEQKLTTMSEIDGALLEHFGLTPN